VFVDCVGGGGAGGPLAAQESSRECEVRRRPRYRDGTMHVTCHSSAWDMRRRCPSRGSKSTSRPLRPYCTWGHVTDSCERDGPVRSDGIRFVQPPHGTCDNIIGDEMVLFDRTGSVDSIIGRDNAGTIGPVCFRTGSSREAFRPKRCL
jgi:hypothetical protein